MTYDLPFLKWAGGKRWLAPRLGQIFGKPLTARLIKPLLGSGSVFFAPKPADERIQDGMFSYVSLEQRVPADHPLRGVRKVTDAVLQSLSPDLDRLYADSGRPSIAPEYILRPSA